MEKLGRGGRLPLVDMSVDVFLNHDQLHIHQHHAPMNALKNERRTCVRRPVQDYPRRNTIPFTDESIVASTKTAKRSHLGYGCGWGGPLVDGPGTVAGHDDGVQGYVYLDGVLAWLQRRLIPLLYLMTTEMVCECEPRGEGLSSVEDVYEGGKGRRGARP